MRRFFPVVLAGWMSASAQAPALAHLDAQKAWRETDTTLERDAGKAGTGLTERANRAGEAAAKANEARVSYLRGLSEEATRQLISMGNSGVLGESDIAPVAQFQQYVAGEVRSVMNNLKAYANDRDTGIQQLRTALERERQSLDALSQTIGDREKALEKGKRTLPAIEAARTRTLEQYQLLSTAIKDLLAQAEREKAAWANYYNVLSASIGSAPENAGAPDTQPAAVTINGIRINNPARPAVETAKQDPSNQQVAALTPASAPEASRVLVNPPVRPAPSAPSVLRSRYVGTWSFPATGGQFFGPQPESATLETREENGKFSGGISVRFKMPAGSKDDPDVRFSFAGDFKNNRVQSFALETTDGAKGTLDLIPGNAFNLLEVNFQIDPRPGKVTRGNFVVLKN